MFWLTKEDSKDEKLLNQLKAHYPKLKKQGYMPVVFISGEEDLLDLTRSLLIYNKYRCEELRMEKEAGAKKPIEKQVAGDIAMEHSLAAQRRRIREQIQKECGGFVHG